MLRHWSVLVILGVVTGCEVGWSPPFERWRPVHPPGPAARENVAFVYHSFASMRDRLHLIGRPRDVVWAQFPSQEPDPDAAAWTRRMGARPFAYAQFTWFPERDQPGLEHWMGMTVDERMRWRLCDEQGRPLGDADDGDGLQHPGRTWWYADANERGFVRAMVAHAARFAAAGYAGLWVDVTGRAFNGHFAGVRSGCTDDPVVPGRDNATALVSLLRTVRTRTGLAVAINSNGIPGDPLGRLDPRTRRPVRDLHGVVAWALHENGAHPRENTPGATHPEVARILPPFDRLAWRAHDLAPHNGDGRVVVMAKPRLPLGRTPAERLARSRQERYLWALGKLYGGPVVVNTGWDFCAGFPRATNCNRTGLAPDLVNLRLGRTLDARPMPLRCQGASCMWVRRYEHGLVAVSAWGTAPRIATVPLGTVGCRRVVEHGGGVQADGRCVTSLTVGTGSPVWGRIFLYR